MIRYFSCLLVLVAGLAAAPEASSPRALRLVYVQAPENAPEKVFLVAGKVTKEIDLPRLSVSTSRLDLPAGPVRVFAATQAPTRDNPLPSDAPFVDIPETLGSVLVVLLPNGKSGPLGFQMLPVEFSQKAVPEGAVMWFNLSDRTIFAKHGSSQAAVAPRRSGTVVPSGKSGDSYQVMVDLAPEAGESETVPFLRARWTKEARRRDLLFVVADTDRRFPRIICVPELMEPEPEQPKEPKRGTKKP
ncbi:MAG: hypothetical protein RIS38_1217 [Verrucomicrobiota bacterium]|jgi:hypothetical protein